MSDKLKDFLGACAKGMDSRGKKVGRKTDSGKSGEVSGDSEVRTEVENAPLDTAEDEIKVIEENFAHVLDFVKNLKKRETSGIPPPLRSKVSILKSLVKDLQVLENDAVSEERGAVGSIKKEEMSVRPKERRFKPSEIAGDGSSTESTRYDGRRVIKQVPQRFSRRGESSSSSESYSSSKKVRARMSRVEKNDDYGKLINLMSKFDGKKVPSRRKFDEESGQSLRKYLLKFERYCVENVRGGKDEWIGELEGLLSGKVLEAFKAFSDEEENYDVMKKNLLEWYDQTRGVREVCLQKRFDDMEYNEKESLFLYCTRLERAFKRAYPGVKVEDSRILKEKFIATIPRAARKVVKQKLLNCDFNGKKVDWNDVRSGAMIYDNMRESKNTTDEKDDTEEIVIDIGREVRTEQPCYDARTFVGNAYKQRNYGGDSVENVDGIARGRPAEYNVYNNNRGWQQRNGDYGNDVNGGQRGSTFRRVPPAIRGTTVICSYCQRMGHLKRDCRKWLYRNRCFGCGSTEHFVRDCRRDRRERFDRSRSLEPQSRNFDRNRGDGRRAVFFEDEQVTRDQRQGRFSNNINNIKRCNSDPNMSLN